MKLFLALVVFGVISAQIRGPKGPQGPMGDNGDNGWEGPQGETGQCDTNMCYGQGQPTLGEPGKNGIEGEDGHPGADGADGDKGNSGNSGAPGLPGSVGWSGYDGPKGEQGDVGDDAPDGMNTTCSADSCKPSRTSCEETPLRSNIADLKCPQGKYLRGLRKIQNKYLINCCSLF